MSAEAYSAGTSAAAGDSAAGLVAMVSEAAGLVATASLEAAADEAACDDEVPEPQATRPRHAATMAVAAHAIMRALAAVCVVDTFMMCSHLVRGRPGPIMRSRSARRAEAPCPHEMLRSFQKYFISRGLRQTEGLH